MTGNSSFWIGFKNWFEIVKFIYAWYGPRISNFACPDWPDFFEIFAEVLICSATVKISNIPSRSNFSSDPDLDFDNIEIKWDLYGTRTRRLAVRHFATHAFCFRSTLPEKIFDQLQAILIGSRISIYDWAQLNKVTLYSSIPWGIRSQFAELA